MKKNLFVGFMLSALFVQADSWTQKAFFPGVGLDYPFCFSIGNKGYVGTGNITNQFWEYDPGNDTWTQKADFGGLPRWTAIGFSIGSNGYAGLGTDGAISTLYQDFWKYDTTANAWSQMANFPGSGMCAAVGFSIGNYGFVATGGDVAFNCFSDLWQFDPVGNAWIAKASLPAPGRMESNVFVIGTNAYLAGGWNSVNFGLQDLWEYNSITDSWTQKANYPGAPNCDAAAFTICDKGYYGVGDPCFCIDFWQYDPATNVWTQKADFAGTGRDEPAFFAIGNKGYIGLGQSNDFWEYTPDSICNTTAIAAFTAPNHICPGSCVTFVNLSSNATSFEWSFPGAVPSTSTDTTPSGICFLSPGNFSVTLIASNSIGSDTLTLNNYITVYPFPPPLTIVQTGDTLTASSGFASYQWYYNTVLISGATNSFYVAPASGDYNVSCLDSNGCSVEAGIFNVVAAVSPLSFGEGLGVRLFPNPVTDKLTVHGSQFTAAAQIRVYNLLGEKIYTAVYREPLTVNCEHFSPGIYFIEVTGGEKIFRGKFVKQ